MKPISILSSRGLLFLASVLLLAGMLSSHAIWTQEYRWQQVCLHMLQTRDYWHPYLDGKPYYDKPLLSYWLILVCVKITGGGLTNAVLRLPSVLAAGITLYGTYWLARYWFDRPTAQRSTWLLLTTFYFIFWGRVASGDMLNVASILLCIMWFLKTLSIRTFWHDLIFFLLLALSALLKGLIGPALVFLIVAPYFWRNAYWRSYLNGPTALAAAIAVGVYLTPFIISNMTGGTHYGENGLVNVFRENILRFFKPFDHEGAWWTYVIYLPVYTLPWTPLWLLALWYDVRHPKETPPPERFILWALLCIFVLLSLSGSRRSYYILPAVPFAVLLASAFWQRLIQTKPQWEKSLFQGILLTYSLLCLYFIVLQPFYYLSQ